MDVGKNNNQKIATMLYVVMFGDGRGLAHCNAHTWKQILSQCYFIRVDWICFQKRKPKEAKKIFVIGKIVAFLGMGWIFFTKQNQNKQEKNWMFGYGGFRCTLKGM